MPALPWQAAAAVIAGGDLRRSGYRPDVPAAFEATGPDLPPVCRLGGAGDGKDGEGASGEGDRRPAHWPGSGGATRRPAGPGPRLSVPGPQYSNAVAG